MSPELERAVYAVLAKRGAPQNSSEMQNLIEYAMTEAIAATRELCLAYPAREMTGATNNWEVGKRISENISRRK